MIKKAFLRGESLLFVTALLWSTTGVFSIALHQLNPMLINGLRSFFGVIVLLIYARFRIKINKTIVLAALCISAVTTGYLCSLAFISPGTAVVLQYSAPIFVLIETCIFHRKRPSWLQIFIVLLAFSGIMVLFSHQLNGGGFLGCLIALGSGLAFSGVFFVNKMESASPLDSFILGFLLNAAIGLFFLHGTSTMLSKDWITAALMGVANIGLAYIFFIKGIKTCSSFNASIIGTLEVVLLPLWVYMLYGTAPGLVVVFGGIMIITAVVLNNFTQ